MSRSRYRFADSKGTINFCSNRDFTKCCETPRLVINSAAEIYCEQQPQRKISLHKLGGREVNEEKLAAHIQRLLHLIIIHAVKEACAHEKNQELIPADSSDVIVRTKRGLDSYGNLLQNGIPNGMAQAVIDGLEFVAIHKNGNEAESFPLRPD